jgi:hypothetical protein
MMKPEEIQQNDPRNSFEKQNPDIPKCVIVVKEQLIPL